MRRATAVLPAGEWDPATATATVTLPFDQRFRRRIRWSDDGNTPFLLDLPRATLLRDGDGLRLADGGLIRVLAAREPVAETRPVDAVTAARLAWHLGNRHAPVQILPDGGLRLPDDPVLVAMLEGLGAVVRRLEAPFAPEGGAYGGGHGGGAHGADHDHHGHDHDHDHP
ncbi:MAG: urease accessory protein UreE [Magnetococcales bacterium]|nr:urease accessory protein UreE [Magnetococcales bacterium]